MINRVQFDAFNSATLLLSLFITHKMLCVSAVFAVARCLSVRLSHSCIVSRRLKICQTSFSAR